MPTPARASRECRSWSCFRPQNCGAVSGLFRATRSTAGSRQIITILTQRFEITSIPLEMQTNRLARFQAYSSPRLDRCTAGDIVDRSEEDFHPLPPLETVIRTAHSAVETTSNTLPVTLVASANELGLLQVCCVSADPCLKQSWPLEFNLRPPRDDGQPRSAAVSGETKPNIAPQALAGASRPPASTAGSIGTPIFAANRFPCRSRTHQYGLVGIPAPPCAAPPGMAMAGIRSARSLPRRYRLKSRYGFPLISIEQNNLSRAPGYRVRLQLVDICRTVDFEDALRREASKGEKPQRERSLKGREASKGEKPQSRCDGSR